MNKDNIIIGRWLLLGVAMLTIQVLLGGITRLTGSGLSMTEWKPIIGMIPPLSEGEWQIAFDKYKQIAQFKFLNQDFLISDFKFIFFWEWFHRNWAHFISFTFIFPFIYFLKKGMIKKHMILPLLGLFVLGAAQGFIGKIMVDSGLNDEDLYVSHIRLAVHFISAMILICATCWYAFTFMFEPKDFVIEVKLRNFTILLLVLIFVQLTYGAFMAGLKAATVAPTWPSINGEYFPESILSKSLVNHPINIHFVHRMLAYLIFGLVIYWTYKLNKINTIGIFNRFKKLPFILVLFQVVLGICAVLFSTHTVRNSFGLFEWFAQLHQLIAMLLVMSLLLLLYLLKNSKKSV